jgi:hypothetical protein
MPEIERGSLPINTTGFQIPKVPSEPDSSDRYDKHLLRIADLEGRLSSLKHQTRTAMEQAKKSSDLLKKVSSLEDQMSVLMVKIAQLEECDVYMTKIIETACKQLQCKLLGAPQVSLSFFLF